MQIPLRQVEPPVLAILSSTSRARLGARRRLSPLRLLPRGLSTAFAVVMLFIGSSAGEYLLVHGPVWAWPLAVLQRECLVSAGIWCCVTFLIHAIRAARDRSQPPGLPCQI